MATFDLTPEQSRVIEKQVSLHTTHMTSILRSHRYDSVRLFDQKKNALVAPFDITHRDNDFIAAAYVHALAIYQTNGDDCIDANGNTYELKLVYVDSRDMNIGKRGGLQLGSGVFKSNLENSIHARYKVYPGTDKNHHNKETALILMSCDHQCYITGFMMHGDNVTEFLHESNQNCVGRTISLGNFIKHGYEFGSSVPHIGWQNYYDSLHNYVMAREGRLNAEETQAARQKWIELCDIRNLNSL